MSATTWTCPYCQQNATILSANTSNSNHNIHILDSLVCLVSQVIACPNTDCRQFTITANLYKMEVVTSQWKVVGDPILSWVLRPQSMAKPYPEYVPLPIRQDYTEACLISDLSPKASATLARRCLQGIIRDYWKISKNRLVDEIAEIKDKVDPTTWLAIDAIRKIGNIGAHMEKDINVIVDVEPQEAKLLITLIEILLRDWYIARHERQLQLEAIINIAKGKEIAKG